MYTDSERGVVRESTVKSVSNSKVDGNLKEIVLQDDEPMIGSRQQQNHSL